jgi:hypothetical protein
MFRLVGLTGWALVVLMLVAGPAMSAIHWEIMPRNAQFLGNVRLGDGFTPDITQAGGGSLAVGGTLEVNGRTRLDGQLTTTGGITNTGAVINTGTITNTGNDFSFVASADGTTYNVTGLSEPDANYTATFEPTLGVSISGISSRDANGFYVTAQSTGTATVRGHIYHY